MKLRFYLISICFYFSCSSKIIPGKYVSKTIGVINIDNNLNYKFNDFRTLNRTYSSGKIIQKKDTLTFIPDSAYIFIITRMKVTFSEDMRGYKKLIILSDSKNKQPLSDFIFNVETFSFNKLYFDSLGICTYPDSTDISSFRLYVREANQQICSEKYLVSQFIDTTEIDKHWNTIEMTVHVSGNMFGFLILDDYLYKNGSIDPIDNPSFKLRR
jgi:hypothetical protein